MVSINQQRRRNRSFRLRHGDTGSLFQRFFSNKQTLASFTFMSVVLAFWSGYYCLWNVNARRTTRNIRSQQQKQQLDPIRPNLHLEDRVGNNAESMNAIAQDVLETLHCHNLLNRTDVYESNNWDANYLKRKGINIAGSEKEKVARKRRRRLDVDAVAEEGGPLLLDDERADGPMDYGESVDDFVDTSIIPTASHLFCLAALWASSNEPSDHVNDWKSRIHCPATESRPLTLELMELWSSARASMPPDLLRSTLIATEKKRELVGTILHLWAPPLDNGINYMVNLMNQKDGEWSHLSQNLGANKLFVDVGSYLGITGMAVSLMYPRTQVVSIEAASPNWLLQQMNWRCNHHILFPTAAHSIKEQDSLHSLPTVLLSGVGPSGPSSHMAKMMWRPDATTATRSWTAASEIKSSDIEITVQLHPWHSILNEAGISNKKIDVLNVDCEGCEYNLIPALSDTEFQSIATILGTVHWGYIPSSKLPSSKRGHDTHERLCQHENVASTVKECCAFPVLPVMSGVPGEALIRSDEDEEAKALAAGRSAYGNFPPKSVTARDVAGALCDDFETWRIQHHLDDIDSDWGWFQITSFAT